MNRRQLLRLLALGVVGHTLDIDRLLWVPGQKTIFLPVTIKPVSWDIGTVVAMEINRISKYLPLLFERDDTFYRVMDRK